jgi:hypothetical protein
MGGRSVKRGGRASNQRGEAGRDPDGGANLHDGAHDVNVSTFEECGASA